MPLYNIFSVSELPISARHFKLLYVKQNYNSTFLPSVFFTFLEGVYTHPASEHLKNKWFPWQLQCPYWRTLILYSPHFLSSCHLVNVTAAPKVLLIVSLSHIFFLWGRLTPCNCSPQLPCVWPHVGYMPPHGWFINLLPIPWDTYVSILINMIILGHSKISSTKIRVILPA